MSDSRKHNRKETESFIGVYDRATDQLVGRLVDMTREGLKLRSVSPLDLNLIFQFKMDLPFEISGSVDLAFEAESVWSSECDNSTDHYTGFQMLSLTPLEIERIENLINSEMFIEASDQVHVTLAKVEK